MSFETIRIYRDIPAIDGFLQVPPNKDKNKNKGVDINLTPSLSPPLGTIVRLTGGSGRQRGSRCGSQEFFRLFGITPNEWYDSSEDIINSLKTTED